MHHPKGFRPLRIRWHAEHPPTPLGCRWCGHPPYAHDAASLPHRARHEWEQPTAAQVHARMAVRRRLGLCGRSPAATPLHPLPRPEPSAARTPPRPEPQMASPDRHRRPEQPATAVPYRRGRPPGTRIPSGGHEPYRKGAAA